MPELSPELEKIISVFDHDKIIGKKEVEQVLEGITTILESFKKKSEADAKEMRDLVEEKVKEISDHHNSIVTETKESNSKTTTELKDEIASMLINGTGELRGMIERFMELRPKDGEPGLPADKEEIVQSVLEQIKLPEQKEVILDDGETIVEKINAISTEGDDADEYKIDWEHIKGAPKKSDVMQYVGGGPGIHGITSANANITITDDPVYAGHKKLTFSPQITVSPTAPSNPNTFDLWIDTSA